MPLEPAERAQLDEWLGALRDGIINDTQFQELDALLRRNPEAVRYYVDYITLCVELRKYRPEDLAQVGGEPSSEELLREVLEQERLAAVRRAEMMSCELVDRETDVNERWAYFLARDETIVPVRHVMIPRSVAYAAVAVLAIALFWIAHSLIATPGETTDRSLATLVDPLDGRWTDPRMPTTAGAKLTSDMLQLESGRVHVRLPDGVDLVLEGPCELELLSGTHGYLHSGTVVAKVSPSGVGYTLSTPSALFIDMGTGFAVTVRGEVSETTVFEGVVAGRLHGSRAEHTMARFSAKRFDRQTNTVSAMPYNGTAFAASWRIASGKEIPIPQCTFITNEDEWRAHLKYVETFEITPEMLVLAREVATKPRDNTPLGTVLTFDRSATSLMRGFRLRTLQNSNPATSVPPGFVYNDTEDNPARVRPGFHNALSIGDINDYEDDDFEIELLDGPPLYALAFELHDNDLDPDERLEIIGEHDEVIAVFEAPGSSRDTGPTWINFVGIISDVPIRAIRLNESPDPDDIALGRIFFGDR